MSRMPRLTSDQVIQVLRKEGFKGVITILTGVFVCIVRPDPVFYMAVTLVISGDKQHTKLV